MFAIGRHYSVEEIWSTLDVPELERTDAWLSGLHEYQGSVYVLCSPFRSTDRFFTHRGRLRLGELYWTGESGDKLEPQVMRCLVNDAYPAYLFFADAEEHGYEYLGRGILEGFYYGAESSPTVSWEVDRGDGMICLRKNCDALRCFCTFGPTEPCEDATYSGKIYDLQVAGEWLELAAAIDKVEVDTLEFGTGVLYDSGVACYESARSDLLSDIVTGFTVFTYIWMAVETLIDTLGLAKVPRSLKPGGASRVDKALYFLKRWVPDTAPATFMSGYSDSVERLRRVLSLDPRYRDIETEFVVQPHMNRWGRGLHVARRLRNRLLHGALAGPEPGRNRSPHEPLTMPEPAKWSGRKACDTEVAELCARLALLTSQLLISAECMRHAAGFSSVSATTKAGEELSAELRTLHLRRDAAPRATEE